MSSQAQQLLPESLLQLGQCVAWAESYQQPLVPSPYDMRLLLQQPHSASAHAEPVHLNMSRLNRILDYPHSDATITVESGITLEALHAETSVYQQHWGPVYPEHWRVIDVLAEGIASLTLGGNLKQAVLGMGVFVPSLGQTHGGAKVVKNVAGYDMNRLHIGGHHQLGIMSEVTLKLSRQPEAQRHWLYGFSTLSEALQAVAVLVQHDILQLSQCELFQNERLSLEVLSQVRPDQAWQPWQLLVALSGEVNWVRKQAPLLRDTMTIEAQELFLHPPQDSLLQNALAIAPAEATVFDVFLPLGAVGPWLHAQNHEDWAPLSRPILQARPTRGLVRMIWPELMPEAQYSAYLAYWRQCQQSARAQGGHVFLRQAPGQYNIYQSFNVPAAESPLRNILARLKQQADPHGVLSSLRYNLQSNL